MPEKSQQTASWVDARKYPRFEVNSEVRLHRTDGSNRHHDGACNVVAIGGIGVVMTADFDIGEEVEAEFVGSPSVPCRARIVYRRGQEYGLQFLEIF